MIAIFAGSGDYPIEIKKSLIKLKKKVLIINLSNRNIKNSFKVSIGQFGKILSMLKKNNVKEAIFAGKIERPDLRSLKFDFTALRYLPALKKYFSKGDGKLLMFLSKILKKYNVKIIDSHKYSKDLLLNSTVTTKKPSKIDKRDFLKGKKILNDLSKFDNAQAIVIDNGYILSIEASEGTDMMLNRTIKLKSKYKKKSGILIKLPKRNQSLKFDLPTIGYKTINLCIKSKLNGIFLLKNKNIFLNQQKSISLANKNNFFISAI